MILDLGTVKPGSTIRIPISSFGADGESVTATGLAASDIIIVKNGSTTERASTNGFTATTDFDTRTGLHVLVIDLADDTDAGFYAAGSEYLVAIDNVTINSQTVRDWVARFRIGYDGAALDTTIATLASQVSFTLSAGPADDDAFNGWIAVVHDKASAVQVCVGVVADYTGSTKTVTFAADPGIFTMAAGDNISLFPPVGVLGVRGTVASVGGTVDANVVSVASNAITAAALAADAVAEIADGVCDEALSGHTTAGSLGKAISDTGSSVVLIAAGVADVLDVFGSPNNATISQDIADLASDLASISGRIPAALVSGRMDSSVGAMAANVLTASALATDAVQEIWTTALTESYATDGAAFTAAQALYGIWSGLFEFEVSGTSKTNKKLDGSATAFVQTLDDATNPTSTTRSS